MSFRYKDYRHDAQQKTMTLEAEEFIRRFLLHVLPEGFQRIRYYGFLANRYREHKLARCRKLLDMPAPEPPTVANACNVIQSIEPLPVNTIRLPSAAQSSSSHLRCRGRALIRQHHRLPSPRSKP